MNICRIGTHGMGLCQSLLLLLLLFYYLAVQVLYPLSVLRFLFLHILSAGKLASHCSSLRHTRSASLGAQIKAEGSSVSRMHPLQPSASAAKKQSRGGPFGVVDSSSVDKRKCLVAAVAEEQQLRTVTSEGKLWHPVPCALAGLWSRVLALVLAAARPHLFLFNF